MTRIGFHWPFVFLYTFTTLALVLTFSQYFADAAEEVSGVIANTVNAMIKTVTIEMILRSEEHTSELQSR